jgi:rod shape-determining protein MreC
MSVAGHTPPPFFKRGPAPLARLVFFLALAVLLMVADLRFKTLDPARAAVAALLWPLQKAVMLPVEGAGEAGSYFSDLARLKKENEELRERQLAQANLLLRQTHLDNENRRLRALLDRHGIRYRTLTQPARVRVLALRPAARPQLAQRLRPVQEAPRTVRIGPGSLIIDLAQPAGRKALLLLDPRSTSSVFRYPDYAALVTPGADFFVYHATGRPP